MSIECLELSVHVFLLIFRVLVVMETFPVLMVGCFESYLDRVRTYLLILDRNINSSGVKYLIINLYLLPIYTKIMNIISRIVNKKLI